MSAIFSQCRQYRYRLDRLVGSGPPIAFLLHNPSTAAEVVDDPTSRRGIGFAKSLGFGRLIFINPWARIATNSTDLWKADDPVGPSNDQHIGDVVREIREDSGKIVCAWGRINPPAGKRQTAQNRIRSVIEKVYQHGLEMYALGTNQDGSPKHPLYLPKNAALSIWTIGDSNLR